MRRRIVLVGATGAFGERLARLLAPWPQVELVLAARGLARAQTLAAFSVKVEVIRNEEKKQS